MLHLGQTFLISRNMYIVKVYCNTYYIQIIKPKIKIPEIKIFSKLYIIILSSTSGNLLSSLKSYFNIFLFFADMANWTGRFAVITAFFVMVLYFAMQKTINFWKDDKYNKALLTGIISLDVETYYLYLIIAYW